MYSANFSSSAFKHPIIICIKYSLRGCLNALKLIVRASLGTTFSQGKMN
jgi:hypothetical protein